MLSKFTFDELFWSHDDFEVDKDGYCKAKEGGNYTDQRYVYDVFGKRVLDMAGLSLLLVCLRTNWIHEELLDGGLRCQQGFYTDFV